MDTLDIGGGFCDGSAMDDVAAAVNAALDVHFPVSRGVRIVAEPGRCAQTSHLDFMGICHKNAVYNPICDKYGMFLNSCVVLLLSTLVGTL